MKRLQRHFPLYENNELMKNTVLWVIHNLILMKMVTLESNALRGLYLEGGSMSLKV